jgi:hypothetical protein
MGYSLNELPPRRGHRLLSAEDAVRVCDFDETAQQIIENTPGKSYRKSRPHRAVRTANIVNDFFHHEDFEGKTCIEIGPGHYNFALIARHLGARVTCFERDPVHARLGRHLGFEVIEEDIFAADMRDLKAVDGIWLKNVQYRGEYTPEAQGEFATRLHGLLTNDAWGWCVLRNRDAAEELETYPPEEIEKLVNQRRAFESRGWMATAVLEGDRKRYALNFAGAPWILTLRLSPPTRSE